MYAKIFFERFWEGDQRNELFVCMPFHDSFDNKFMNIIVPSSNAAGFQTAERVKENWEANVITDRIFDGISNSKMILFDLTDDPKSPCQFSKQINVNVLYELGIANAIREPEDIIMIRESSSAELPFDISGMKINFYKNELEITWLADKLKNALKGQEWFRSKRVGAAATSIDPIGFELMYNKGRLPEGYNHFGLKSLSPEAQISTLRLIDLGILWFASDVKEGYLEYAFRWTPFGREVIKRLGFKLLSEEEFKKSPDYDTFQKEHQEYLNQKGRSKQ